MVAFEVGDPNGKIDDDRHGFCRLLTPPRGQCHVRNFATQIRKPANGLNTYQCFHALLAPAEARTGHQSTIVTATNHIPIIADAAIAHKLSRAI